MEIQGNRLSILEVYFLAMNITITYNKLINIFFKSDNFSYVKIFMMIEGPH